MIGVRISIVGASGAGKSFLAAKIAVILGIQLHSLDDLVAQKGSSETECFIEAVDALIMEPSWIVDGHYRSVRQKIWDRADTVIWLDAPLWQSLWQLSRRFLRKTAAAKPNGRGPAKSKRNATTMQRVHRVKKMIEERTAYREWLASPANSHLQVVRLASRAEVGKFLAALEDSTGASDSNLTQGNGG